MLSRWSASYAGARAETDVAIVTFAVARVENLVDVRKKSANLQA